MAVKRHRIQKWTSVKKHFSSNIRERFEGPRTRPVFVIMQHSEAGFAEEGRIFFRKFVVRGHPFCSKKITDLLIPRYCLSTLDTIQVHESILYKPATSFLTATKKLDTLILTYSHRGVEALWENVHRLWFIQNYTWPFSGLLERVKLIRGKQSV